VAPRVVPPTRRPWCSQWTSRTSSPPRASRTSSAADRRPRRATIAPPPSRRWWSLQLSTRRQGVRSTSVGWVMPQRASSGRWPRSSSRATSDAPAHRTLPDAAFDGSITRADRAAGGGVPPSPLPAPATLPARTLPRRVTRHTTDWLEAMRLGPGIYARSRRRTRPGRAWRTAMRRHGRCFGGRAPAASRISPNQSGVWRLASNSGAELGRRTGRPARAPTRASTAAQGRVPRRSRPGNDLVTMVLED
jgi:hypothetical protein